MKKKKDFKLPYSFHDFVAQTINKFEPKFFYPFIVSPSKLNEEKLNRPWQCGVLYGESLELGKKCINSYVINTLYVLAIINLIKLKRRGYYLFMGRRNIPAILIEIRQDLSSQLKAKKWVN